MKNIIVILTIFILLIGCNKESGQIKDSVVKYNKLLAAGYRDQNMDSLLQAATEEQVMKAYHHMSALGEAELKMDANLREIKFVSLKLQAFDSAEIRTSEKWDYVYLNINSGETLFDNSVDYNIKYAARKRQNSWVVADVVIEKTIEEKSSKGIFERPEKEIYQKKEGKGRK